MSPTSKLPRFRSTQQAQPLSATPTLDEGANHAEADVESTINVAANATMLLPSELLQPGETIVLFLKPSVWYVFLACLRSLAVIALATLAATYFASLEIAVSISRHDVLLLGIGLAMVRLFWQFLEWLSRIYVLTDQRVIRVKGVLRVEIFEVALKNIQHTECLFTIRERLFGLGTIAFNTSGSSITEAYWLMVSDPLHVHQKIIATQNRYH